MIYYLESSAAAKLLLEEAESAGLKRFLDQRIDGGDTLISSVLVETDLRRTAHRAELDQAQVSDVLDRLMLVEPDRGTFSQAGLIPGAKLRTLDAMHIAIALRVGADFMVSYDKRQNEAAHRVGLHIAMPGAD